MGNNQFMRTCCRCTGTLSLVAALFGCGPNSPPLEPKILTFNYMLIQYSDPAAFIAEIQSGQKTVADELPANPCNFTADAAASTPLSIDILGNPGQNGFNITITSATLVSITTTNPANCQPVSEINMTIGAANETLDVGGQTNKTSADLVMGGNSFSSHNNFFEGSLTGYNQQTGYASGEFQFVASSSATAANVLLLVHGSFADD